ncbi:hypothetical protein STEG23_020028 [Scotinomys teguina]
MEKKERKRKTLSPDSPRGHRKPVKVKTCPPLNSILFSFVQRSSIQSQPTKALRVFRFPGPVDPLTSLPQLFLQGKTAFLNLSSYVKLTPRYRFPSILCPQDHLFPTLAIDSSDPVLEINADA